MIPVSYRGKVALVTGGSSGVGLATAKRLVERGASVVLLARTQSALDQAVRAVGGKRCSAIAADLSDLDAITALPGRILALHGRIDLLVNNAGVNHRGAVDARTPAELTQIIHVNLLGPMLLTKAMLPSLRRGGAIVNVASLAGKIPVPHEAAYSASKAGLRAFTRAIDCELRERGIRAHSVCPGPIDTGFLSDLDHVPDIVLSQPMSSAEQVADAVMRVIDSGARELDVPGVSGKLATFGYLFPQVMDLLRPAVELRGAFNRRRIAAARRPR
jgi:short-subunit dehydrogenase